MEGIINNPFSGQKYIKYGKGNSYRPWYSRRRSYEGSHPGAERYRRAVEKILQRHCPVQKSRIRGQAEGGCPDRCRNQRFF